MKWLLVIRHAFVPMGKPNPSIVIYDSEEECRAAAAEINRGPQEHDSSGAPRHDRAICQQEGKNPYAIAPMKPLAAGGE
jgi:hypothetical protein